MSAVPSVADIKSGDVAFAEHAEHRCSKVFTRVLPAAFYRPPRMDRDLGRLPRIRTETGFLPTLFKSVTSAIPSAADTTYAFHSHAFLSSRDKNRTT